MMNSEKGQALPLAILALAIGMLVIAPFLGHASTSLISSRTYGEAIAHQNACDAGVEHAIWSLTRGGLAEQLPDPGDEITYQLGETLNGVSTTVTVTANVTGGGGTIGDIGAVIDTLEFDTADGWEPDIIQVSGNVYAIAYRGPSNDGFMKTVSIAANGDIGNTVIDTLEYDTADGWEPDIIQVSGNVFAIAYRGPSNDGFVKTISIATNGDIGNTVIDTLEYDTADGYEPRIIHISGNVYAIAYRGTSNDGFVKTISIATNGDIGNSVIDSLEYDTADGYEPRIIHISGNVYAIAYRGTSYDGFVKTMSIATNGDIGNTVIDTLEYDTSNGYEPDIVYISGNVYAITYRGTGNDGFVKTISIAANGDIANTVIDSLEFNGVYVYEPNIIPVSSDVYVLAYRGSSNAGYLKTVSISASGSITDTVIETAAFDTGEGYEPRITHISGDVFAIAYRGVNSDGFVKTININTQGGSPSASYEIVATAGNKTIRAFVNTDNETASIASWQIE
jgi:hypothetical protein